jgi:RimJ/RimL family protein N-acetyltransferase
MASYRIVYGANERASAWLVSQDWQIGTKAHSIALERDGELVAVCTFDDYRGSDIRIHAARAPEQRFLPRMYWYAVYAYPFVQLGCLRVTAPISSSNAAAISLVERVGFILEARLAKASRGEDLLIFVLWREACRFLAPTWKEKRHGWR